MMSRMTGEQLEGLGHGLKPGDPHYRAFVGPPEKYDTVSAMQFNLLTALGLREEHYLLDVGCGSLRAGRLLIPYLRTGHYFGIEPEQWLVDQGIQNEIGQDMVRIKHPIFSHDENFTLTKFGRKFDFIVAQSIFSHASVSQISRCLEEAGKVMTESSIFAATFGEGEENYSGNEWVYPGCIHYTFEFFSSLVQKVGLTCEKISWSHPNGQTWVVITHRDFAALPKVVDLENAAVLESRLVQCEQQLSRITHHPYVRMGLWIRRLFGRLRGQ